MVSNSADSRSFFLTMCILAPESTTNSLSSGSFQQVWYRPHTQIRRVPVLGWRINIPNLELFPTRISKELFQIAVPIIVLPKDDRTDCAQEDDVGHLYLGRGIQLSGHSDFVILNNGGASSILIWAWSDTCNDIHHFCGRHLRCRRNLPCDHCMRARIVLHSVTSEYNTSFVFFLKFWFQLRVFEITDVHYRG